MLAKKNKIKTISDKITEKFLPKALADPENDPESLVKIADFDEEDEADDFGLQTKPSDIRKRNAKLLSEFSNKYKGKVTSRKELEANSEDSASEETDFDDSDSVDSELEEYKRRLKETRKEGVDNDEETDEEEDDQSGDENSEENSIDSSSYKNGKGTAADEFSGEEYSEDEVDEEEEETDHAGEDEEDSDYASTTEDLAHNENQQTNILSETNQNNQVQKGLAVQNQLKIWEKLLEIRIHSQKISIKANSLPPPETFNHFCTQDENFNETAKETATNVERLLENMLDMQRTLASQYSEMKDIFNENRKRPSTVKNSQEEPAVKRFAAILSTSHESLSPYRNSVLLKWDDRMRLLAPGAGKKNRNMMDSNFDVLQKIDAVLLRKDDLLAKSQTVKGNYELFGCSKIETNTENQKENDKNEVEKRFTSAEIYDDTDFYHQQLRELIEYKSNTSANPVELNKQFAELQKLRQKMKKKVDTRASKGRKIRYVVHNKLVNFMAPNDNSEWTDESKTELYRSLFAT